MQLSMFSSAERPARTSPSPDSDRAWAGYRYADVAARQNCMWGLGKRWSCSPHARALFVWRKFISGDEINGRDFAGWRVIRHRGAFL